jgi:hypothetical protein
MRGIDVYRSGLGKEYAGRGRHQLVTLTFKVLRVTGTPSVADARIRVTSARVFKKGAYFGFLPHAGEIGTLRLRHGIVTDSVTRVMYCAPGIDECDPTSGVDTDMDPAVA